MSQAVPARFTSRSRFRPSAATRFAVKPNSPTAGEHRDENQDVEHDRRDDRDQPDDIHRSRAGAGASGRDAVDDQADHDQQEQVETDEQFAVEVAVDSGDQVRDRRDQQHHGEERGEDRGEHGGEVLDDALLRLDEPGRDDDGAGRARGQHPGDDSAHGGGCDRGQDQHGQPDQHGAAQGDECVVDDPLAGEADEVHAAGLGSQLSPDVGDSDDEPEHDGEVDRDEGFGAGSGGVREQVHRDG